MNKSCRLLKNIILLGGMILYYSDLSIASALQVYTTYKAMDSPEVAMVFCCPENKPSGYLLNYSSFQHNFSLPVIPLTEGGQHLKQFYLSMDVEHLWIAGQHINWETGIADNPDATSGIHTHCSAFIAAACKRLNIYILRPPEHKQILLANAQYEWLASKEAAEAGWKPLQGNNIYETAQSLANKGTVVVAICKNPDEKKPGHAALVMPGEISVEKLSESGPTLIMAGTHNFNKISLKNGFRSHLTGWPEHAILFYYNTKIPVFALP